MDSQLIADRYELQDRIGRGGMAQVYRGVDRRLGRTVAVKLLDQEQSSDPLFVERFRREARAAAALNDPHIVSIYDWGEATRDDLPLYYMVMEYVDGPNLKEEIWRDGPLPEAEALDIAAQVAQALQVAHDHGVIHRDVKPHNILIGPGGLAKVADFGIARAAGASPLTQTNALSGTAQYMSPEQAQLHPVDRRSDIYSLGMVLYEMLTSKVPFEGENMIEVAMQHVNGQIVPPRQLRPDISRAADAIVMRALEKDPDQRFQTAAEMRAAITTAVVGLQPAVPVEDVTVPIVREETTAIQARAAPVNSPVETDRAPRRRFLLLAIPVVVLVGLVGGTLLLTRPGNSHRTSPPPPHTAVPHPTNRPVSKTAVAPHPTVTPQPPATTAPAATTVPTIPPTVAPTAVVTVATVPVPTSVVPAVTSASQPIQAVNQFYADVIQGKYDQAAQLWTAAMQARCPPSQCINGRFADTTVAHERATLAGPLDANATQATVRIDFLEELPSLGQTRHYVGNWNLVRSGGKWLLDSESLTCIRDQPGYYCP